MTYKKRTSLLSFKMGKTSHTMGISGDHSIGIHIVLVKVEIQNSTTQVVLLLNCYKHRSFLQKDLLKKRDKSDTKKSNGENAISYIEDLSRFKHFTIGVEDNLLIQKEIRVITEEELAEIKTSKMVEYPELPYDLVDYLSLFEMGTTSKELRKLIHIHSDFNLTMTVNETTSSQECGYSLNTPYIARLTRSNAFSIPTDLKRIGDILQLLSTVLVFKMMVQNNIDNLTNSASTSNLHLKRHFDSQEDGFVQATKRNYCAQTPIDNTTGIFKSIFNSSKK